MAGLLARAGAALRGAVRGLFRPSAAAPDWAAGRARVLLAGPTGAGKSALVNALLGEGATPSAAGAPVTAGTVWHAGPGLALADTRGLEAADSADQVAAFEASLAALGPDRRPHLVWLVLNAEGGRAFAGPGTLAALAASLRTAAIPCLVVLTHAEPGPGAHARLRARVAAAMGDVPVLAVNTRPLLGEDGGVLLPAHGVDALWAASRTLLPPGRGSGPWPPERAPPSPGPLPPGA